MQRNIKVFYLCQVLDARCFIFVMAFIEICVGDIILPTIKCECFENTNIVE